VGSVLGELLRDEVVAAAAVIINVSWTLIADFLIAVRRVWRRFSLRARSVCWTLTFRE
jgi:hypothetical protein